MIALVAKIALTYSLSEKLLNFPTTFNVGACHHMRETDEGLVDRDNAPVRSEVR
jgi:hypothetical protein